MKNDCLNVPVQLLQYALRNHCLKELRVFLALKMECNGAFRPSNGFIKMMNARLGYKDDKSTRKILENLKKIGWVDHDLKSHLCFLKGFEALRQKLGLRLKASIHAYSEDLSTNRQFKAFAVGATICNLINSQKVRLWRLGQSKGSPLEERINLKSGYLRIANSALATVLECSQGQAFNQKKLAKSFGYISVKRTFFDTGIPKENWQFFKEANPELSSKMTLKRGRIALKTCDVVKSKMRLSHRGKI